jgi:hypothetical protein
MLIAFHRQAEGLTDKAAIKGKVLASVKEALEGSRAVKSTAVIDGKPIDLVSGAGIFRLVFNKMGADRLDLHQQEVLFAAVERTVDELLEAPKGEK